ncbi:MAG TPA: 5-oxoprolinase subunit PxpB [Candidatus Acidoferrum sp.]|jgi:inhibitor of KinA
MGALPKNAAQFRVASDQSLLVYFAPHEKKSGPEASPAQNQITTENNEQVRRLLRLMESEPIDGVRNLHPAYASICVKFDARELRHSDLEKILRGYIARVKSVQLPPARVVEIPVCYGGDFGPDLNDVAEFHGITADAAIEAHCSQTYLVYFLGFAPGFAYLGELPEALVTPRLPTPRRSVVAGSVGIAGRQTGVYPISTPGGWRLLGRTPSVMFRPERPQMSLLSIGDRVRFVPISRAQFSKLEHA